MDEVDDILIYVKVKLSVQIYAPISVVWGLVLRTSTLDYIASPLVTYQYLNPTPRNWKPGQYPVKVFGFGVIPFGRQTIVIELPDSKKGHRKLRDNGFGSSGILRFIDKWDHTIELRTIGKEKTDYTDTIQIRAGILTPLYWMYAYVFYFWRQCRWKSLSARGDL